MASPPPSSPVDDEYPPYTPLTNNYEAERVAFIPAPATSPRHEFDGPSARLDRRHNWLSAPPLTRAPRLKQWGESLFRLYERNTGLLFMMASQLFGASMNMCVKVLNSVDPPVHPLELVVVRMFLTYVFTLSCLYYKKIPYPLTGPPGLRALLVVRGVAGFFGLFGIYFSLQYLTLSDAVVLTFLSPTATALVSYFVLGESFSRREAVAGLVSLAGVILIARPSFLFGGDAIAPPPPVLSAVNATLANAGLGGPLGPAEKGTPTERLIAVGVSFLGVCGTAGAITTLRAIGKRAHFLHTMAYFAMYSMLVASVGMVVLRIPIVLPRQWLWGGLFLLLGICGFLTQVTLTMGLQREKAGRAMLATYTQVVIAAVLERIVFGVYPSKLSMMGIVVILGSAMYVAATKESGTKTEERVKVVSEEDALVLEGAELGDESVLGSAEVRPLATTSGEK